MIIKESTLDAVRVGSLEGIRPAAESLRDIVEDLSGLRCAVTDNIAVREPMKDASGEILASAVFGFRSGDDARWWQFPQLALTSPLPMACRFESEPFWCNAQGIHTSTPNLFLSSLDLSNFHERALTSAAIVAPIQLPFGQIAAASFLSPNQDVDDLATPFQSYGQVLALLARVFVSSYVKVTERRRPVIATALLTKREVECLRWAASGKTNDEIGAILGLKRTTVRFHIRSASVKLDAVNRDQTLFKAAQLGFLAMIR